MFQPNSKRKCREGALTSPGFHSVEQNVRATKCHADDRTGKNPSFTEGTTYGNHDCNQSRHLYGSPKARDANNSILFGHRISLTASSGMFLTWMKERTWFWLVVVVVGWMGVGLGSGVARLS